MKSNAKRQKSKALQRAIEEAKVREDFIIVEGNASSTDRTIATYAQKFALTLYKFTCHEGTDYQKKVIKNALNNIFYNKQCLVL